MSHDIGTDGSERPFGGDGDTVDVVDDRVIEQTDSGIEGPNYRNRGWLYTQYHGLKKSMQEIANECGVNLSTIKKWMKKHDIERRDNAEAIAYSHYKTAPYRDKDWLYERYVVEKKSSTSIANECGVAKKTILSWLDKHGIGVRSMPEARSVFLGTDDKKYRDEGWLREEYVENGRTSSDIAEECDVSQGTITRWLHRHGIDTRDGLEEAVKEARKKSLESTGKKIYIVNDGGDIQNEHNKNENAVVIKSGNATYKGSPLGIESVSRSIEDRDVVVLESPWRDSDWMYDQYVSKEKNMPEIAEICGVNVVTVHNWLGKHGIETRETSKSMENTHNIDDTSYKDKEWLYEQYVINDRTMTDIAEECGCSRPTIGNWLDNHGIERRSK